jgi:photosystem II stability/assembly factor-like uncharacterized protein
MITRSRARRTLLAGLSILLLASCDSPRQIARSRPAPTELVGSEEKEGELRRAREIWEELRHRTPPGVSWRAVEIENRRRNLAARAALLQESKAATPDHWQERGSFDQTGRTHVTAVGSDGRTLFIGTDNGGVFSGLPGGQRWVPRSDGLGIGVQSFVIVPGRPEVWIAGDVSGPLYISTNQGLTWSPTRGGPGNGERVFRLLRDPGRPRTVYAITNAGAKYKLYRSDNGGVRFAVVSSGQGSGIPDIWIDRVQGGPLYLAVGQELKVSTDRGATFRTIGTLPAPARDVVLAGSEAGAPTFYAAVRGPGGLDWNLLVSEDGGQGWRVGSRLPDFWLTLTASIKNPRLVFAGGVNAYRSVNAGRTFQAINEWYEYYDAPDTKLHADLPGIDCVLYREKETCFFNTDGGTFLSENGGRTVRNITRFGLGNGQYYGILTSANDSHLIAAGAQDQGYQVSQPGSGSVLRFDQLISGDYGSLTSSDGTHDMLYSAYPGFVLIQSREGAGALESFGFPPAPGERRHPWIPALAADPDDSDVVYYADRRIWRVERQAEGRYFPEELPHDFGPGPQPDFVSAFAISPADRNRWYAGTPYGRTWFSQDGGQTWAQGPELLFFHAADFLPSPTDPDVCYLAGSGYQGKSVYRTADGGKTWQPFSQGLPPTFADALAFDDPVRQELYAATHAGPFKYNAASGRWVSLLGREAPLTTYTDVEGVPAEGIVRFATYGRGIWDYDPAP